MSSSKNQSSPSSRRSRKKETAPVSPATEDRKIAEPLEAQKPIEPEIQATESGTKNVAKGSQSRKKETVPVSSATEDRKSTEKIAQPLEAQKPIEPETEVSKETTSSEVMIESLENLENLEIKPKRSEPIPAAGDPRQYRAIGLIKGKYKPSEEQLTKGNILTPDGTLIDSVILGRVISLIKKHLDLEQEHLWVVYPRVRKEDGNLHVQIVGVWEPETLKKVDSMESDLSESDLKLENGYFSIRGEVIYTAPEEEKIIIKIRQLPKKPSDKIKFFKLELKGILPDKTVSHFWDLEVQHENNKLILQEGIDLGRIFKKKTFPPKGGTKFSPKGKRSNYDADSASNSQKGKEGGEKPLANNKPAFSKPTKGSPKKPLG